MNGYERISAVGRRCDLHISTTTLSGGVGAHLRGRDVHETHPKGDVEHEAERQRGNGV